MRACITATTNIATKGYIGPSSSTCEARTSYGLAWWFRRADAGLGRLLLRWSDFDYGAALVVDHPGAGCEQFEILV